MGTPLNTIGVKIGYGVGTSVSAINSWTYLPDIKKTPSFNQSPTGIDATTFDNQEYTSSVDGLKEMDDSLEYDANFTADLQTAWGTCVSAYSSMTSGQKMYFIHVHPDLPKACAYQGKPSKMGLPEMSANSLLETTLYVTPLGEPDWVTKPSE